jgi:hypothetical protein
MPPVSLALVVTPFRSDLVGVALRLGLRTLASLASLRTLVVFLPSCASGFQFNYACCYSSFLGRFPNPRKRAKKASFWGPQKRPFFCHFFDRDFRRHGYAGKEPKNVRKKKCQNFVCFWGGPDPPFRTFLYSDFRPLF